MKEKRTELGDIGEFGLIERLKSKFTKVQESTALDIGDDAALIDKGDKYSVVTTDMLLEGVHFDLSYMPLPHLGYKSIAVNVSDLAAMNATPQQVTVSIALSNRFSVEAVEALYSGIEAACKDYKVDLIGGDTTSSKSGLVISVTAIGEVEKDNVTKRSTAQKNDIVCVTGDLGGAYMGLQILEREKQAFIANPDMQPNLSKYEYIVGRQLRPRARMDVIHELAEEGVVPTSMMDISDGLASELFHIATQSKVGIRVIEENVPIDKETFDTAAMEFKIDPITAAMNGGEDYELLFTVSQADYEKIKRQKDVSIVGFVTEEKEGVNLVTKQEQVVPIKAQGWNHFNK